MTPEPICRWCRRTKAEHKPPEQPNRPRARCPCLGWQEHFVAREAPAAQPALSGLDDFPLLGPHDHFARAARRAVTEAHRLVERAVTAWARQAGLTIEQWCEVYEAGMELVPGAEGTTMTIRVTAHLKGYGNPVFPPRRYEPTEETEE